MRATLYQPKQKIKPDRWGPLSGGVVNPEGQWFWRKGPYRNVTLQGFGSDLTTGIAPYGHNVVWTTQNSQVANSTAITPHGIGWRSEVNGSYDSTRQVASSEVFTFYAFIYDFDIGTNGSPVWNGYNGGFATVRSGIAGSGTSKTLFASYAPDATNGAATNTTAYTFTAGNDYQIFALYDGANVSHRIYDPTGNLLSSESAAVTGTAFYGTTMRLMGHNGNLNRATKGTVLHSFFNPTTSFSFAECDKLALDPFAPFRRNSYFAYDITPVAAAASASSESRADGRMLLEPRKRGRAVIHL